MSATPLETRPGAAPFIEPERRTPIVRARASLGLAGTAPRVRDLLDLTRPRVVALVLLTAPAVFVVEPASATTVLGVLAGTSLLAAGCSALNACWEHESDGRMARTRDRPLPSGRLTLSQAVPFAIGLTLASLALIGVAGGLLAALVGVGIVAWYVGLYTVVLKRRSVHNMVVGGVAGAAAPLVADAVDGSFGAFGIALWLLVFLWQPAHFWAIGLFRKGEYAAAGIPMLPSVIGDQPTRWWMLGFTAATVTASLLPVWTGHLGALSAVAALGLGGWLAWKVVAALRAQTPRADRAVFFATIAHLTVLCAVWLAELLWIA